MDELINEIWNKNESPSKVIIEGFDNSKITRHDLLTLRAPVKSVSGKSVNSKSVHLTWNKWLLLTF